MIRFGTGGNPLSTKLAKTPKGVKPESREAGLYRIKELGLKHMEVEFVHGVRVKDSALSSIKELAQKLELSLTSHGSYYINLASLEKDKYKASQVRVKKIIRAGALMEAKSITFHPAYYQGRSSEEVSKIVTESMTEVLTDTISEFTENHPLVSLETTGKGSQWGDLNEIVDAANNLNQKFGEFIVSVCIDFAHIQARSQEEYSEKKIEDMLNVVEKRMGHQALENLHIHLSGIEYSEKGERRHQPLEESNVDYKLILKILKEMRISGWMVCESPNLEKDAQLLQNYYEQI